MNICGDNRFEIIRKAKEALIESTNISEDPDEMKVLNRFLFRCWQMGWLDKYDVPDTNVGEWIPCSERLPEEPDENPLFEGLKVELYLVSAGEEFYPFRAFWNGKHFADGLSKVDAEAWMPLPQPYKEGDQE